MAKEVLGTGNDDGFVVGRSDEKIGFYGLTTPIVKQTLTIAATASSTIISVGTAIAELQDALIALGLFTGAE